MKQYDKHSVKQTKQNKTSGNIPLSKFPPNCFNETIKFMLLCSSTMNETHQKLIGFCNESLLSACMHMIHVYIYIHTYIERWEKYYTRACMCEVSVCVHECTCVLGKTPTPIPLLPCPLLFARIQSKRCCSIYPLCTADHSNINKKDFL